MKKVLDLFPLLLAAGALFGAPAARAYGLKDHAARFVRSASVVDMHEDLPEQLEMNRLGMFVDVSHVSDKSWPTSWRFHGPRSSPPTLPAGPSRTCRAT